MELASGGNNRRQPKIWDEQNGYFNQLGNKGIRLKKLFDPSVARAARAYTGLGHVSLAQKANVASRTVYKLERDGRVTKESLERILDVLHSYGVSIIRDDVVGHVCGLRFDIDNDAEVDDE
ncbi:Putative transcriptional regulator, XRE family (modular protein) [Hoeflea sp. EC-HK425]|nr:Putative transcriptional regulator, XRE family (modular protein) [Hoeflea sp. EC-HK425]